MVSYWGVQVPRQAAPATPPLAGNSKAQHSEFPSIGGVHRRRGVVCSSTKNQSLWLQLSLHTN